MYRFLKVNLNLKKESYKKDIDTFLSQKDVSQYPELVDKTNAPIWPGWPRSLRR